VVLVYGPQAAFLTELFRTHTCYSGASLGHPLGAILGGGYGTANSNRTLARIGAIYISIYLSITGLLTLFPAKMLTETHGSDLGNAGVAQ
jgi:MHS family shikimate/dehydroshikimate transporter-like MFS transporter